MSQQTMSQHAVQAVGSDGTAAGERSEHGAGTAGLVPSKTNQGLGFLVSFGASVLAEKRVKRLKRSVWASGHLHELADRGHRPPVCWFVTLTYRGVKDWNAQHISKAVEGFRQWCRRLGVPCRYTWVAELQQRGAVHYHLLAWLPVGVSMPMWDRGPKGRAPWWPHGMTERDQARSGVGYLMKYLSKLGEFHRFPKGLRLYGIGGLNADGKAIRRWHNLPQWCKYTYGVNDLKRQGGRLVVQATGEILASPYCVDLVPGGLRVRVVGHVPEFRRVAPFSSVSFA